MNCAEYLMHKFLSTRSNNVDDDGIDIVGGKEHERRSETTDSSSQLPAVPVSLKINAYFLCDDDNDIELAMACIRHTFLVLPQKVFVLLLRRRIVR